MVNYILYAYFWPTVYENSKPNHGGLHVMCFYVTVTLSFCEWIEYAAEKAQIELCIIITLDW